MLGTNRTIRYVSVSCCEANLLRLGSINGQEDVFHTQTNEPQFSPRLVAYRHTESSYTISGTMCRQTLASTYWSSHVPPSQSSVTSSSPTPRRHNTSTWTFKPTFSVRHSSLSPIVISFLRARILPLLSQRRAVRGTLSMHRGCFLSLWRLGKQANIPRSQVAPTRPDEYICATLSPDRDLELMAFLVAGIVMLEIAYEGRNGMSPCMWKRQERGRSCLYKQ